MTYHKFYLAVLLLSFASELKAIGPLLWSDEFGGPEGSAPNSANWGYDLGGSGWGNGELEFYTDSTENAAMDGDGNLRITATQNNAEKHQCWYGPCQYTSARLLTLGKYSNVYGRIEANIQIPHGKGVWPAFWLLGDNLSQIGWPTCGEIDIMEVRGSKPSTVLGTVHGPDYSIGSEVSTNDGSWLSDKFHVYAVDWTPNNVTFSLDGVGYKTITPSDLPAGKSWVFEHPFFIILNFAVGGQFDGSPDGSTSFPQSMLVDYVRVFRAD